MATLSPISYADFDRVDIRVGRIVRVEGFPEARKPAYKLLIDFGPEIGARTSSAQLTRRYGPFMSQVLTLGVPDADGAVVLIAPDKDVPIGGRLF
jgi:tRNA-binding protein